MQLNLKPVFLSICVIFGLFIFISNTLKLELKIKSDILTNKVNDKIFKDNDKNLNINIQKEINQNNNINEFKRDLPDKKLNQISIIVKKDQTFSEILDNFNLINKRKYQLINAISEHFDLRDLKVNQKIIFFIDNNEELKEIIIEIDFKTNLKIILNSQIKIEKKELKTYSIIESKEYFIKDSLYADGVKSNLPNKIIIKLIQLFSFDLDFQRDIKKDTEVSVSYEITNVENKSQYSYGDINYARITIKNNTLEYFKFTTDDGFIDYFNREGKNVKKSILKTPLDGAKVSSNFGMRKHPILGFNKMHKGIDFAAPKGTPVYAGGNGVIEIAGNNGAYGKYIRIRHTNDYKTAYAHLSGFRKGISKGVRVNQGDIIGYVGSTGRSTGPHLHYEIIYQGKQINPLTLKLPSGKILQGDELKRFQKKYKMILAEHLNNLFE